MESSQTVDISRMSRAQRRLFKKSTGHWVPGRNMPYIKAKHGSIANYNKIREEEIQEEKAREAKKD